MSYNQLVYNRTINIDIGISLELFRPFLYKIMITYFSVGIQGSCT